MNIKELKFYQSHREDYKIKDNQYKCPICNQIFSIKAFSQHIRKEHYNKSNNIKNSGGYNGHYNDINFIQKISKAAYKNNKIRYDKKLGIYKDFEVECSNPNCRKHFIIRIREKNFLKKKHYFCCKHCSKVRIISNEQKKKISKTLKILAKNLKDTNPKEFARCFGPKQNNRKFTSKNERLIRNFIIKTFPNDEWTFGGCLTIDGISGISRDLYSNKLKICFEYDGIWHFKNIHGQLELKQKKRFSFRKMV